MTTSCRQIPTATRTDVTQTFTETTTFTTVTTTLPGDVATSIFSTCLFGTGTSTCTPFVSTLFISMDGLVTFTEVPVTITETISATITTTLFGSTCSTINGGVQSVSSTSKIKSSSTASSSLSTTPTASSTAAPALTTSTSGKKFPVAAVAGGVVGGIVILAALAWIGWKYFYESAPANYTGGNEKPKKLSDNDSFNKEKTCFHPNQYNAAQNAIQCEPQNTANNVNTQQNQSQQNQSQQDQTQDQDNSQWDHRRHRLPKRAEEKLKEKIDEYINAPPVGQLASGVATVSTLAYQEENTAQQGHSPGNLGYGVGGPNYMPVPFAGNLQASNALPQTSGPYNVSAPGQLGPYGQPSLYGPQTVNSSQYRGYAEPSSSAN